MFGKEHMDVIHDIENQIDKLTAVGEKEWGSLNFEQAQYQHPQNKQWCTKYNLTEDAFALVAMSYVDYRTGTEKRRVFASSVPWLGVQEIN